MNNKMFFTIVLNFIVGVSYMLSAQLQADVKRMAVSLDDQVLEIKKEISGGGTFDLIDGTTERVDGICSFDKDRLKTGRSFFFDRISIGYASNADSGKEGELEYNTKAPVALQNALFIISQDGREVLRMPMRDVHSIHTGEKNADDYSELDSLRYLVDEREIKVQIKFPGNVALPAATKHYVYVRLKGLQTTKKTSA